MHQTPTDLDFGNISLVFRNICDRMKNIGLYVHCQTNADGSVKTWQTVQFYSGKSLSDKPLGAVQYEGSNDYAKKRPHIVNWRFYRNNLPTEWKSKLEQIDNEYRMDTNDGPRMNPEAQSIAFKFTVADERSDRFIDAIIDQLDDLTNRKT